MRGRARAVAGPGSKLCDRYVLEEEIRRSRLGPVYRAVDTELSGEEAEPHYVAVQLLPPQLASDEHLLERFKREFVAMQSWSHPNVPKILTFERDRDDYFLTMEHLDGVTLRDILNELRPETLSTEEAFAVVAAVANALDYAHSNGVVHAGITAENVFVTHDYQVKLTNFAPAGTGDANGLSFDAAAGLDRREDVRGLAAFAYELLCGHAPVVSGYSSGKRRSRTELERPPGVTRGQWKALATALLARRQEQFESVPAFVEALGLTGREDLRVEQAQPQRAVPRRRRRHVWRSVAVALVLVGAVGAYLRFQPQVDGLVESSRSTLMATIEGLRPQDESGETASGETQPSGDGPPPTGGEADPVGVHAHPTPPDGGSDARPARDADLEVSSAGTEAPPAPGSTSQAERGSDTQPSDPLPAGVDGDTAAASEPERAEAENADATETAEQAAPPVATPATPEAQQAREGRPAARPSAPARFSFRDEVVTVRESRGSVAIDIERLGGSEGEASVIWWTSDGTALAEEHYIDLGARTERFVGGERLRTVYVPLVVDSVPGDRRSFYVHLAEGTGARLGAITRLAVVVVDDS